MQFSLELKIPPGCDAKIPLGIPTFLPMEGFLSNQTELNCLFVCLDGLLQGRKGLFHHYVFISCAEINYLKIHQRISKQIS